MADTLQVTRPMTLGRPRGARRFEAFSPKLARRAKFYRLALLEQWLLLEANPKVITFCERPGYVLINEDRHLADFCNVQARPSRHQASSASTTR
ncbi:hypothetical protein B0G71_7606 [Paraburkholderia sp. BL27I4N3]|uniref:hypothetical protein n=1 Tax=Paraburkholderia sp. BL27I4N3 TaxID=1938805 RepID=UPI000E3A5D05|nr:hypothetical protein [Paraburkholderia sp. BL27I4N3]REE07129.1 hypothetical protein B0G71_7606 [Paraburkholderia sp. BL27I4N3]